MHAAPRYDAIYRYAFWWCG